MLTSDCNGHLHFCSLAADLPLKSEKECSTSKGPCCLLAGSYETHNLSVPAAC